MSLYSIKMRASAKGAHVSGAERIVRPADVPNTLAQLAERALKHAKGTPDFINLKVEDPGEIIRLQALPVTTYETATPEEGRAKAAALLESAGIARVDEIMARFPETHAMRGAMILDADTLERLEPDSVRGVRATYMDDAESVRKGTARGKNHYAEAIVLATKVQSAPGIVAEICVSDDPDYVTGYVATKEIGYARITTIKSKGSPDGGRIFLYRGPREGIAETVRYLEKQAVIVDNVPSLSQEAPRSRWKGLEDELAEIRAAGRERVCRLNSFLSREGTPLTSYASNDYLGLARDERVIEAAREATARCGAGSTGSRLLTGTHEPHLRLEEHLARFKGTEAAITWSTGYMANVGTISALVKKGDVILSDALNHASIIDGCRLSGAEVRVYAHLDYDDLDRQLASCSSFRRRLVVSDAVFSMDGDRLDLPRFLKICRAHDAFSMIDEAHSTGVLGANGRGLAEAFACDHADVTLGTLSKALGSSGGFVCGSRLLIDYLRNRSRAFIFSTAPGAGAVAAADEALRILESDRDRVGRLRDNAAFLVAELRRNGVDASSESAIVPIPIGDTFAALHVAAELKKKGFDVPAIRYPTVAEGAARLRLAVTSEHTRESLSAVAQAIGELIRKG